VDDDLAVRPEQTLQVIPLHASISSATEIHEFGKVFSMGNYSSPGSSGIFNILVFLLAPLAVIRGLRLSAQR
jgi:hypothetical protein